MKHFIALLLVTATPAWSNPTQTALRIAPDQLECITETVYHDWAAEPEEVKLFYRDHHIASLLAAYAGVKAGIYDSAVVETAYGWYGCDWIQTLELTQRATDIPDVLTVNSLNGQVSLDFLHR